MRETNRVLPCLTKQIERKPSHFVSKIHSGFENGSSTSVASIGWMTAGMRALRAAEQVLADIVVFVVDVFLVAMSEPSVYEQYRSTGKLAARRLARAPNPWLS